MKERPILFSGPMVRALLDGSKTQTRRKVKGLPIILNRETDSLEVDVANIENGRFAQLCPCPYGQPGDRLWVREAHSIYPTHGQHRADGERWGPWGGLPTTVSEDGKQIAYYREGFDRCDPGRWRPSIHMPRWASRITLEITSVRVERLQGISMEDAKAEGAWGPNASIVDKVAEHFGIDAFAANPRKAFQMLWEQINGPGSWDANPWVWVVEFRRALP